MSSEWKFTGNNNIIKIFYKQTNHSWIVVLKDNLHVPLHHESLKTLSLDNDEIKALEEAKLNAIQLSEIKQNKYIQNVDFF